VEDADYGDGLAAMNHVASWIANADSKNGFLATGLTLLATTTVVRLRQLLQQLPIDGLREIFGVGLSMLALIFAIFAAVNLMVALVPRTKKTSDNSRFAFPNLSQLPYDYVPVLDIRQQRIDAWRQAVALSKIAMRKVKAFRRALYSFVISAILLAASYTVL
jgi:hypothetical protein